MDDDLFLLEQWRAGDQQAGQALFRRYFREIYRFFEHKAGADADDLAQRTFMACVSARDQFRNQSTFRTYLFAIARNELYGHLRRLPHGKNVDFEATSIAELVTSPSSRLDRSRQVQQLRGALRELPAEQQVLLELHYWHDLDAGALGQVFGATPGAIRVRLLRARRALRDQMARLHPDALAGVAQDRMSSSLSASDLDAGDVLERDR